MGPLSSCCQVGQWDKPNRTGQVDRLEEVLPNTAWDCHRTADQLGWCQGGSFWGGSPMAVPLVVSGTHSTHVRLHGIATIGPNPGAPGCPCGRTYQKTVQQEKQQKTHSCGKSWIRGRNLQRSLPNVLTWISLCLMKGSTLGGLSDFNQRASVHSFKSADAMRCPGVWDL